MDWIVEENGKIRAQITQVPLRLAWAITVHQSQGMSMDAAVMDLSQVFEFGQGYVALSRVRRLSGLYILGINEHALKVHPKILEKDIDFKTRSEEARKVFEALATEELKKMHDNFITTSGGRIKIDTKKESKETTALEKIREKHQNAYKKWTSEEEAEVVSKYKTGKSVKDIAILTGRQVGGIRARLVKLGLIE